MGTGIGDCKQSYIPDCSVPKNSTDIKAKYFLSEY